MKILVIGGSYFLGRVFVMQAAGVHEITLVNRGTYSMEEWGVRQIKGDRRDKALWQGCSGDYDVIVDFCAYEKGDIAGVLHNIRAHAGQYLLISTVDVYARGTEGIKGEDAPLETRVFPGEAGAYIAGKAALEEELWEECARMGMEGTVLRPAILYGPYNYAPRESAFIQKMVRDRVLPHVSGADGRFQFVYVKDAAEAAVKCLQNEKAYGEAFNLCQDEVLTYDSFYEGLKGAADLETEEVLLSPQEADRQGLLPFPASLAESELCSNEKSRRELGMAYLSFQEGMARTYRAFKAVYGL